MCLRLPGSHVACVYACADARCHIARNIACNTARVEVISTSAILPATIALCGRFAQHFMQCRDITKWNRPIRAPVHLYIHWRGTVTVPAILLNCCKQYCVHCCTVSINQSINRLFIHITPRNQGLVKTRTCNVRTFMGVRLTIFRNRNTQTEMISSSACAESWDWLHNFYAGIWNCSFLVLRKADETFLGESLVFEQGELYIIESHYSLWRSYLPFHSQVQKVNSPNLLRRHT